MNTLHSIHITARFVFYWTGNELLKDAQHFRKMKIEQNVTLAVLFKSLLIHVFPITTHLIPRTINVDSWRKPAIAGSKPFSLKFNKTVTYFVLKIMNFSFWFLLISTMLRYVHFKKKNLRCKLLFILLHNHAFIFIFILSHN